MEMTTGIRVAQYVRMSTEHQQYSTENQSDAIRKYADERGMIVVRTYADHGKSGLNIAGRSGLASLLRDVQQGNADFFAVLVYDVSRWGRFQDADESAYYEYVLKQAGIRVHYCAEPFENDVSLPSALIKTLKRTMAGEYSRELSVKVFAGQCRLVELGFRQGSTPGYGLRRQLIDEHGHFKQVLGPGERKSIHTDRVILIPGPPNEVEVVRQIFRDFTENGKSEVDIAAELNGRSILNSDARAWTRLAIYRLLTNPKYMGSNVYNRYSSKLRQKCLRNPPEMWISKMQAFEPVVERDVFERAQRIFAERSRHFSDEDLLKFLRGLLEAKGYLTGFLIDETAEMPSSFVYRNRFGSLLRAYTLIGWSPEQDFRYIEINRSLRARHKIEVQSIIDQLRQQGASVETDAATGLLTVNSEYSVSLVLARCRTTSTGGRRWVVRLDKVLKPDITIAARLTAENDAILDYYVLPRIADFQELLRLRGHNAMCLEVFRFDDLDYFSELARRVPIEDAA
jgi:DNA invertase Pin-like site-specific DNA recombinase